MFQDLRYAARVLMKNKGWTAMVVLSLALGIGANSTLFSAVNGLVFRTIPVSDPDGIVRFRFAGPNDMSTNRSDYGNFGREMSLQVRATTSYPVFRAMLQSNQTLTGMFAGAPLTVNAVVDGRAEIATAYMATGNYFEVLGVPAKLGRTFTPGDDQPDAPPAAVISEGYWHRRFGGNAGAVGKVIHVNGLPVTIVGVIPLEFTGVQRALGIAPDVTLPLGFDSRIGGGERLSMSTVWWLQVMGRVKPGVTAEQVQGNFQGVFQAAARGGMDQYLAKLPPEERASSSYRNRTQIPQLRISSGARGIYDTDPQAERTVKILMAVVALLLLIVCANVANLLLSRTASRDKEISVRLSMGATRKRLIRQLLTESTLLASIGGGLGLLVGVWGKELLPDQISQAPLDWRVLLFTASLAMFTGIAFGIAPAFRATRTSLNTGLKEGSRSVIGSRTMLSNALVVVQVSISLVLLVGAGLFLRTVQNLREVKVGFNTENLLLFRVNPRLNGYDQPRTTSMYEEMLAQLKTVPGVTSVALAGNALLSGTETDTNLIRQGSNDGPKEENMIYQLYAGHSFFETMELPLVAGRNFTVRDNPKSPMVAIINETAAKKFFPNENPIGQKFGTSPEENTRFEIVGVTRDVVYNNLRIAPPPTVYFAYFQRPFQTATFHVRTAGDPAQMIVSVTEAVRLVDPNIPLINITTQVQQIDRRFEQERIFAQAYGLFGGIALLLASIGLFGLMSYNVARRTNEIGVRLALGAQPGNVLRMVLRESLVMVAIGLAMGVGVSIIAGRFIASLLFDLAPTDPLTFIVAILVMVGVSALAGYLPARRASHVDPMVALRYE